MVLGASPEGSAASDERKRRSRQAATAAAAEGEEFLATRAGRNREGVK